MGTELEQGVIRSKYFGSQMQKKKKKSQNKLKDFKVITET